MCCSENDPAPEKCRTVAVRCLACVLKLQGELTACKRDGGWEKLSAIREELNWGRGGSRGASTVSVGPSPAKVTKDILQMHFILFFF